MINTEEFKNRLLNAFPRLSNNAEYKFKYFYNGQIIGTNDHKHFEAIGCVKLNTVYKIQPAEGESDESTI